MKQFSEKEIIQALEDTLKAKKWGNFKDCPLCQLFRDKTHPFKEYNCDECYKQIGLFPEYGNYERCLEFVPSGLSNTFEDYIRTRFGEYNMSDEDRLKWREVAENDIREFIKKKRQGSRGRKMGRIRASIEEIRNHYSKGKK